MLRALCECLHIRGAKNSVVFENSYTLKIICISFIINKKTLIDLHADVLMKSWFLPHRLLRSRSSSMLWWSRISANSLCENPRIPRLSFLSVQRTVVQVSLNLWKIFFFNIPSLVGLPRRKIQNPWLAIYFINWENVLKSLVKIKRHAKISINDLLINIFQLWKIWHRLRIIQIDKDTIIRASDINLSSLKWLIKWWNTKQSKHFSAQSIE
jgi:hypothetical protein